MIHAICGFSIVNEAEVGVFLEFPCFLYDPMNVGNLVSGSSAFSKFVHLEVHILLKPNLKDFELNLTGMWNERNCTVVWIFFDIILVWDWKENWPFPVLWSLLNFSILWHIDCSPLTDHLSGRALIQYVWCPWKMRKARGHAQRGRAVWGHSEKAAVC